MLSPLSKISNPENTSQLKLVNDSTSIRNNEFKINKTESVTLHDHFLTFRGTNKQLELKGELLKIITSKNYNVDLPSLADKK